MATDQGKLSNINGLAGFLLQALVEDIPQVGTTTFRPPYTPIFDRFWRERGRRAVPARAPDADAGWHEAKGAYLEPVGHWRRPYC